MSNRSVVRRLESLEECLIPVAEPFVINAVYVNPDGTEAPGGFQVEIPASADSSDRRPRPRGRASSRNRYR